MNVFRKKNLYRLFCYHCSHAISIALIARQFLRSYLIEIKAYGATLRAKSIHYIISTFMGEYDFFKAIYFHITLVS